MDAGSVAGFYLLRTASIANMLLTIRFKKTPGYKIERANYLEQTSMG